MADSNGDERDVAGRSERPSAIVSLLSLLPLVVAVGLGAWIAIELIGHGRLRRPELQWRRDVALGAFAACAAGLASCITVWACGRARPSGLAPTRWTFIGFSLSVFAYLAWFQPYEYERWATYFACAAGGLALLSPFALGLVRRGRLVRVGEFLLFNACLLPFLAEGVLIFAPYISDSPYFDRAGLSNKDRLERNRMTPGSLRYGFELNRHGHHDTDAVFESRPERLVVTIGDSFSQGVVPYYFNFATVAERELENTEVYNIGVNGVGPSEYLILLREEALPLEPDLVVIDLFIGNDVSDVSVRPPARRSLERWFNRRNLMLTLLARRLKVKQLEAERLGGAVGVSDSAEFAHLKYATHEELLAAFPWVLDPSLEEGSFSPTGFLQVEKKRQLWNCRVDEFDPSRLFGVLERIVEAAGDVPVAFMLIPDEFQVEDALWNRVVAVPPKIAPDKLDRDLAQKTLRAWFDERELPYLDLLPLFRAQPALEDGDRHLYKLRDTHWNPRGNELAGVALAEFAESLLVRHASD